MIQNSGICWFQSIETEMHFIDGGINGTTENELKEDKKIKRMLVSFLYAN